MLELPLFIWSKESVSETCPYRAVIARDLTREDNRIRHAKHSCQSKKTPEDIPKIPYTTEKHHGVPSGKEMGEAFRFKTPSSIFIVGPSGCGKTCFSESLLLDHLEE